MSNSIQALRWLNYIGSWQNDNALHIRLATVLEELTEVYAQLARTDSIGSQALAEVISEFAFFSIDYFYFFIGAALGGTSKKGDDDNAIKATLQQDLHEVVKKIERELAVLLIPIHQRLQLLRDNEEGGTKEPEESKWFRLSDAIATDTLQRAKPESEPSLQYCLTLFDESNYARVNRWSYRPLPTVALPSTQMKEPWMWLGVFHEIAHYWYNNVEVGAEDKSYPPRIWNSEPKEGDSKTGWMYFKDKLQSALFDIDSIRLAILNLPSIKKLAMRGDDSVEPMRIWQNWLEETFADVFGILQIGPAYSHSLVLLLLNGSDKDELFFDDSDHPISFLRPYIQYAALQALAEYHELEADTFLKIEKSLLGWTPFDLPSAIEVWKTATGWLASESPTDPGRIDAADFEKSHEKWAEQHEELISQPFGRLRVEDYRQMADEVVALITRELFALAKEDFFQCYSWKEHELVIQVATSLAQGDVPNEETQEALTPALMLAAAWYAWREITQAWINFVKPRDGMPALPEELIQLWLHKSDGRAEALNKIRAWLHAHAEVPVKERKTELRNAPQMDGINKVIQSILKDDKNALRHEDFRQKLSVTAEHGYLSRSFAQLLNKMEAAGYERPCEKRKFLLGTNFSVIEFETPNRVCIKWQTLENTSEW